MVELESGDRAEKWEEGDESEPAKGAKAHGR